VRSSLAARLDMVVPSLKVDTHYTPGTGVSLQQSSPSGSCMQGYLGHKKASRVVPARVAHPVGD
jgi:hypothetical protein